MSILTSFITWAARGFTAGAGIVPALVALAVFDNLLKKASAIWLRAEFSTQTNRTLFMATPSLLRGYPEITFAFIGVETMARMVLELQVWSR